MHAAAPVQAADRVRPAPPLHRLGPFLGHVVLRESLQGADELAVDDPGRERVEVPGDRRHPNLVEQRQALLDITVEDQQPCFGHSTERARRRVKPRTQLDRPPRPRPSAGQVAGQHALVRREPPQATRSPASRADRPGAARLVPASPAPAPSARYRRAGASPREPPHLPPRPCRRPPRTTRTRAPTPRWSRRDAPPRRRPRQGPRRSAGPARPSASAFMKSSNAVPQSPRDAASRARWTTASATTSVIARHRTPGRARRPAVTVEVTAVTVLLTHLGCGPQHPASNEEDPCRA